MNFNIRFDISKFIGAQVMTTKNGVEVIVIPINENHLVKGKNGSLYANLLATERKHPGPYGDTHFIKQRFSKDEYNALPPEYRENIPFFGSMGYQKYSGHSNNNSGGNNGGAEEAGSHYDVDNDIF